MDKLVNLLNNWSIEDQMNANWDEFLTDEKNQIYLIFWCKDFIKRLVENDKILESEVRPVQIYDYEWKYADDEFWYSWFNQWLYYRVLMNLSISDTPIDDLCGYLKDDNEELRIEREFQKWNTIFPM